MTCANARRKFSYKLFTSKCKQDGVCGSNPKHLCGELSNRIDITYTIFYISAERVRFNNIAQFIEAFALLSMLRANLHIFYSVLYIHELFCKHRTHMIDMFKLDGDASYKFDQKQ